MVKDLIEKLFGALTWVATTTLFFPLRRRDVSHTIPIRRKAGGGQELSRDHEKSAQEVQRGQ